MEPVLHLLSAIGHTVRDVLPIAAILFGFQWLVIRRSIPNLKMVLIGFVYVLVGLALFLEGLDQALFPLGRLMAQQLTAPAFIHAAGQAAQGVNWWDYRWVYLFAAAIGFSCSLAEPALIAVAMKAHEVSGGAVGVWGLRVAVAVGAATGITLGVFRIVTGTPLHYYIIAGYVIVMIQTAFAPRTIIPLAYDSGGVTTSTVTVPLVTALGLGLASAVPGRSPLLDGFGLIALTVLCPLITVMGYAQLSEWLTKRRKTQGEE
ncbi:MAG: DUF1538 domain-containing protein [Gammaproteobacteria bacterium]|nr:DUF1538 domain-containing protein [Gammaproteobacteria bacterium]